MLEKLCNDIEWDLIMKPKMKYVSENITSSVRYLKIKDAIKKLTTLAEQYPEETRIDFEVYDDYGDTNVKMIVEFERLQTEAEMAKEYLDKRKQDDYRRQQYEALKKEFEK